MARIAVLGAGNGSIAAAAHLSLMGHEVFLSNRTRERLQAIKSNNGEVRIVGGALPDSVVKIAHVDVVLSEAVEAAEVILICIPASGHAYYAEALAPLLQERHVLMLNPGSTGGALHFAHVLARHGCDWFRQLCESSTLTYGCRIQDDITIGIFNLAPVLIAAFPGRDNGRAIQRLLDLYPEARSVDNVLETSFGNVNAILHPAGTILNAGWVEFTKGDFLCYYEGTTPAVATIMQAVDRERCSVVEGLGLRPLGFLDYFAAAGYTTPEARDSGSFYRALQESRPNRWIKGPKSLKHRYIEEDVGFGLVPMTELGRISGTPMPITDALITLASEINQTDYREVGLTREKMGLKDVTSATQLLKFVEGD